MCAHYLGIRQLQVDSCHFWAAKKKRHSIICDALVFCWHRTQPEIGQLQGAPCELLWKEAWPHHFSGLGLCWHRIPPEIGQLQGALCEPQWKEASFHHLWCLGLCWHRTQPEIGQLQGAPDQQQSKEVLFLYLSCLGLCWHQPQPEIGQLSRCPSAAAVYSGVIPSSVVPWSMLAPDSTRNRTTSRCPSSAAV